MQFGYVSEYVQFENILECTNRRCFRMYNPVLGVLIVFFFFFIVCNKIDKARHFIG